MIFWTQTWFKNVNFNSDKNQAAEAARKIRLLALDVDGILTDGRLYYSNDGEELKAFHALDGHILAILNALCLKHLREGPFPLLAYQSVLVHGAERLA